MSTSDLLPMGVVQLRFSYVRRLLLPIYGTDQLMFFAVLALAIVLVALFNPRLALCMGIGGFISAMFMMQASTPSRLLLPSSSELAVVQFLDAARLLRRGKNDNEWINRRGRLYRWETDTIRLRLCPEGILLTGREYDLKIVASRLAA